MNNQVKEAVKSAIKFGALQATAHPMLLMQFVADLPKEEHEVIEMLQDAISEIPEAWDALDNDSEVVLELLTELKDELVAHIKEYGIDESIFKTVILYGALQYTADSDLVEEFDDAKTDEEKELLTSMKESINANSELYKAVDTDSDTVLEVLNSLKNEMFESSKKAGLIK